MKIIETEESKKKREEIVKNILISFGEQLKEQGGIRNIPVMTIVLCAREIIKEVEKN